MRTNGYERAVAHGSNLAALLWRGFRRSTKRLTLCVCYLGLIQAAGNLDSHGGTVLFPNMLIVVNCAGHYVAELVGATEKYFGLVVKGMKNNRFIDT
jgi:hypothetical protein